jgi:hypothetical protein
MVDTRQKIKYFFSKFLCRVPYPKTLSKEINFFKKTLCRVSCLEALSKDFFLKKKNSLPSALAGGTRQINYFFKKNLFVECRA